MDKELLAAHLADSRQLRVLHRLVRALLAAENTLPIIYVVWPSKERLSAPFTDPLYLWSVSHFLQAFVTTKDSFSSVNPMLLDKKRLATRLAGS